MPTSEAMVKRLSEIWREYVGLSYGDEKALEIGRAPPEEEAMLEDYMKHYKHLKPVLKRREGKLVVTGIS